MYNNIHMYNTCIYNISMRAREAPSVFHPPPPRGGWPAGSSALDMPRLGPLRASNCWEAVRPAFEASPRGFPREPGGSGGRGSRGVLPAILLDAV